MLYHYPCPDGAVAALAAYLYHSTLGISAEFFPNTVYSPLQVNDLNTNDFDVFYLLDFVGPEGFAVELCSKVKEVVILDHHKTAHEALSKKCLCPSNMILNIDMDRCGATLAYDYFTRKFDSFTSSDFNHTSTRKEQDVALALVPINDLLRIELLFNYIEDGDLWKWNLPNSKAFSSGLRHKEIDYNASTNPKLFEQLLSLDPADIIDDGERLLSLSHIHIDEAIQKSFPINLGEGKFGQCLAVQDDDVAYLRSDLGHQLAAKSLSLGLRPIGAVAYGIREVDPCMIKVSLRSIGEDTTVISQTYGGGGHRGASSFMISREEFNKWAEPTAIECFKHRIL